MKKIFIILLFLSYSVFAQWTPKQQKSIDSLKASIGLLGLGSYTLPYGRIFIGDALDSIATRTVSGDITLNYLGVATIGTAKVTNAMLAGSIGAIKIGNGSINDTEFSYLNGLDKNIMDKFDDVNLGSGYTLNGSQTDLEIAWTVSNGDGYGILFGEDNQVNFPTLTDVSNLDPGKYGMKGDTAYIGTNHGTEKMLLEYQINAKLDSLVKYGDADVKQQELDTLDFSSPKVIDSWFGREDGAQTVEIINYTVKTISFFVQSFEGVTFDYNGKTPYYADRIALPAFTDGKQYLVTMVYSRNGVYVSHVEYGTAL